MGVDTGLREETREDRKRYIHDRSYNMTASINNIYKWY